MEKYYRKKVGSHIGYTIKAVSVQYLKEQGINMICHLCHKSIRAGIKDELGNKYLENKNIFENSLNSIFLVFHASCKKEWCKKNINP